jgi:hypothetical protein
LLTLSIPILGCVWVPSLAQLAASIEQTGTQAGVALGAFYAIGLRSAAGLRPVGGAVAS